MFEELSDLGYAGPYPSMTRQLRVRALRPACEPCRPAKGRPIAVIEHPPVGVPGGAVRASAFSLALRSAWM